MMLCPEEEADVLSVESYTGKATQENCRRLISRRGGEKEEGERRGGRDEEGGRERE